VLRDDALTRHGKQPVAVDTEHEPEAGRARERCRDPVAVAAHIVRVHRLDEHEVAVRVEAPGELVAVEVEVALDGEAPAPAHRVEAALPAAREAIVEFARRAVVQQGHAPREGETAVWTLAIVGAVVVTTR